jgi:hypothetical protein
MISDALTREIITSVWRNSSVNFSDEKREQEELRKFGLKLARRLPRRLYLDHSHCPVLAPATLAALPSTPAIPNRDVFYVAHPGRSIGLARNTGAA